MEDFARLFGGLLAFVYHCFDRVVILGHLPLLTRPENIVHFFRDVHDVGAITKEVLRQRTTEYNQWVEAFARNLGVPMEWAEKGVRKEDYVRPWLRRMERQHRCAWLSNSTAVNMLSRRRRERLMRAGLSSAAVLE
jgi:hypothetical protein